MNMKMLVWVVFILLAGTQYSEVEAEKREGIIGKVVQCVLDTLPLDILKGGELFVNKFLMNISSQWDPLNPHDYLMWPLYDGPEAWAASCHFSSFIKRCLAPIKSGMKLPPTLPEQDRSVIVSALYFVTLCEHQSTLTDPRTNNAECIHQRMLSDDVLRCLGVLSWHKGNPFLIANINYPHQLVKWLTNLGSSVYECIYKRGNWRYSCGAEVEAMMGNLTKSFSNLAKNTTSLSIPFSMLQDSICDVCKPGSNLTMYDWLNKLRFQLLRHLLYYNQSPYLFTHCKEVDYPLNQCHLRLIWRRDVYYIFCHQVRSVIVPKFTLHLPLCDLGKWMRSAVNVCNMGYDRFMDTASHIPRCTHNQDELFPCYKGVQMARSSWGLVSAGRVWDFRRIDDESTLHKVYNRVKTCIPPLYDHLRQTCRHGAPVIQLIQDLRVVLMIDAPAMFSVGPFWRTNN